MESNDIGIICNLSFKLYVYMYNRPSLLGIASVAKTNIQSVPEYIGISKLRVIIHILRNKAIGQDRHSENRDIEGKLVQASVK